jgi:tetratricopeptide (TPR) repeat protein
MSEPSLITRLKRARIVQVLLVYLGASWVVLQIADVLQDAVALPQWVSALAVLLLLIGLVIILATAWVQALPSTTAGEQAGELPTDWEIAPGDVLDSLKSGRLPHLTWGRAIMGGVVALSLLFGGAGLYVGFGGRTMGLGPTEVVAVGAAEGIAVIPFDVRGQDLDIWREGMMDLLANNLDGVGGYRTIDARTVMARWQELVGDDEAVDLDGALRVAGATGARYALTGSVVGIGDEVRLVTNVHDLDTGEEIAQGRVEGPADQVLQLVDNLAVGTMRSFLQTTGREGAGDLTAETLTTESLDALRDFLEGERHYRRGDFAEAVQSFERAVAADSTFAIALIRLSEAYGWLEDQSSDRMQEYGAKAMAYVDRLPPRYQFIMDAWQALNQGTSDGLPVLKEAVQKYPDDPEAWFLLAETYIHMSGPTFATAEDIQEALDRSVALDPNFAPYLVHVAEWAVIRGDRELAEATIARAEELSGHLRGYEHIQLAIPVILGDSAEAAAAIEAARGGSDRTLMLYFGTFHQATDRFDRGELLQPVLGDLQGSSRDNWITWDRVTRGALRPAAELATDGQVSRGSLGIYIGHANELWGVEPDGPLAELATPDLCEEPFNSGCHLFLGRYFAGAGRWRDLDRTIASLRGAAGDDPGSNAAVTADVLEGIAQWKRGDIDEARRALRVYEGRSGIEGARARAALADLEFEAGRFGEPTRSWVWPAPTRPGATRLVLSSTGSTW